MLTIATEPFLSPYCRGSLAQKSAEILVVVSLAVSCLVEVSLAVSCLVVVSLAVSCLLDALVDDDYLC